MAPKRSPATLARGGVALTLCCMAMYANRLSGECALVGPPNHETQGFAATYKIAKRDFAVVFLIADLGQRALRLAHRTAKAAPAPKATSKKTISSRAKKAC